MHARPDREGLLLINKPVGWTSFDCVQHVKRRYGLKKAGHAGTLDPIASGLLILLTGKATRWFEKLQVGTKTYETTLLLGPSFDTQDITGRLEALCPPETPPAEEAISRVLNTFLGETLQQPPEFSALKVKGKPAYSYARKGQSVTLKPRPITIEQITLVGYSFPHVRFNVTSKKGMYVRTLCRDIAERLGCLGALSGLCRTEQGAFKLGDALSINELGADLESHLKPL